MRYLYLIPEEVRNAKLVSDELKDVARSASSNTAYLSWNFMILALGAVLGYFGSPFIDSNILNAVITFNGIIVGFIITAMLFSGRSQFLSKLTHEQTLLYAHKTRYMLMSQINSLFSFLMCLLFSVLSMIALKGEALEKTVTIVTSAAFFTLGCYRILLLPFQIYDVHSFALDNLIADSEDELANSVKAKTEERLRLLQSPND